MPERLSVKSVISCWHCLWEHPPTHWNIEVFTFAVECPEKVCILPILLYDVFTSLLSQSYLANANERKELPVRGNIHHIRWCAGEWANYGINWCSLDSCMASFKYSEPNLVVGLVLHSLGLYPQWAVYCWWCFTFENYVPAKIDQFYWGCQWKGPSSSKTLRVWWCNLYFCFFIST